MSIQLSVKAQSLIKDIGIEPQIILDIEGVDLIFGARPIFKTLNWDDNNAFWDNNLNWDGLIQDERSRDYISLNETTTNITQQIQPDKGSISSISTVNISIVDKDGEVSKALSFDLITEILGRKAIFAIGFVGGAYPDDANPVFRGIVVDFYSSAGNIMVSLASPESLKKQVFLEKFQTETTALINNSQTTIPLANTDGIYSPFDALKTYIRIDDEIMEVTSIGPSSVDVVRAQLNTVPNSHDDEASVETFYRLQGLPLELALKLMLSKEGNAYFESLDTPKSINFISPTESIQNAIIFDYFNIQDKTGLVQGDSIQLNSTLNNGTFTVASFGVLENGDSYIITNENLVTEADYTDGFSYKSKYNVLTTGLGMLTNEVDVEQFEKVNTQFGANFVNYDLYIKDSIDDAKEFIDTEIFFPQGLYSIPRKARSSVKFIAPPFSSDIVPYLDVDGITKASSIKQRRSVHKYLYNTYVWRYNVDSIEDKFLAGRVIVSANSINRIDVGKKQLKIESNGLRNNAATNLAIENITTRMVDRYQFAPVYFDDIEVNYKTGYTIEVGDIVPFGGDDLQVTSLQDGERGTPFALYEVINKSLNVKNGNIKLNLVSTAFDINARYSVISLASNVGAGSTTNRIRVETILETNEYFRESDKWLNYIGEYVVIRSQDYTFEEVALLKGVDQSDRNYLLLEDDLSIAPASGYIIEPAPYIGNDPLVNERFKLEFAHFVPRGTITSVVSNSVFNVDDGTKLQEGSRIVVNSGDFTHDSFGSVHIIDSIVGNTITLTQALSFTPQIGDFVNNTNFSDGGFPYILI